MTQEIITQITDTVGTEVFGIWFLIGAAFVFFMQAGFAMVETGFTRAKNAGNIIMKNLMDFCIGTIVFIFLGFGLLLGEDALGGLVGVPTLGIFTDYANFDWSNFVFNLVFCATAATIVSGAMAERTKFLSYCIYSAMISAVVYPIEAHWIWGGGWLSQLGFHDFAGSCAIHMVGGVTAFIGAAMEGARIGKFSRDKNGKVTKVHAFPGHKPRNRCSWMFHPLVWMVWIQRCGSNNRPTACIYLYDNNNRTGNSNRCMYDLHMASLWKTRCVYVSECIPRRPGSNHSTL